MALSVTLTDVIKDAQGRVRFIFGKEEITFPSVQDAQDYVRTKLDESRDVVKLLAMAAALKRQPTLANVAQLRGRTITIDLANVSNLVSIS